jgi:hypothetical protein
MNVSDESYLRLYKPTAAILLLSKLLTYLFLTVVERGIQKQMKSKFS